MSSVTCKRRDLAGRPPLVPDWLPESAARPHPLVVQLRNPRSRRPTHHRDFDNGRPARRLSRRGSQASGKTRCSRDCEFTQEWSIWSRAVATRGSGGKCEGLKTVQIGSTSAERSMFAALVLREVGRPLRTTRGNRGATRHTETARNRSPKAAVESSDLPGKSQCSRIVPRPQPATFNPKVAGSSPARPIWGDWAPARRPRRGI